MTADETAWHQRFNSDNWKKAFEEEQRRRERRNHIANERIKLMYEGHSTAEEDEAAIRAAGAFAARTPDFVRNLSNAKIMAEFMQQNGLDGTELSSYRTAFQTLKEQGKLELAKPESADEYYEKHKDVLQDKRVPPIIEARQRQERNTDALTAATSAATARGTVVNVVDYGPQTHGVPPEPDKYSFKQKIRSMSASQIQQRCQDDPAFRKALDNLK
jgi:hypothetical protein